MIDPSAGLAHRPTGRAPVLHRLASLVDWVLRPQCAACGVSATTLCAACRDSLVELGPACPRCAEPSGERARTCRRCAAAERRAARAGGDRIGAGAGAEGSAPRWVDPLPLDRVVAVWRFGGQLAQAIRRLKFAGCAHLARDLAPLWAPALAVVAADALVVPVPLHWRRRWRRGYDHAWLLAHHACATAGLPAPVAALRRVRHAPAQSTLAAAERAVNVEGAFAVRAAVAGRAVVLVDDVMTPGATLAAAARALRQAGAAQVSALVLARASAARD
jgi:ComF family protein